MCRCCAVDFVTVAGLAAGWGPLPIPLCQLWNCLPERRIAFGRGQAFKPVRQITLLLLWQIFLNVAQIVVVVKHWPFAGNESNLTDPRPGTSQPVPPFKLSHGHHQLGDSVLSWKSVQLVDHWPEGFCQIVIVTVEVHLFIFQCISLTLLDTINDVHDLTACQFD